MRIDAFKATIPPAASPCTCTAIRVNCSRPSEGVLGFRSEDPQALVGHKVLTATCTLQVWAVLAVIDRRHLEASRLNPTDLRKVGVDCSVR